MIYYRVLLWTQNDKNFCLLRLISQESLFIVDMQKKKYLLIFFQVLIFGANSGVKRQKWPKMTENCVLHPYLRKHTPYDRDFWYTYTKRWHLHVHFSFFKVLIFWVARWLKGQKMAQKDKQICLSCSISETVPHMIVVFSTCVTW